MNLTIYRDNDVDDRVKGRPERQAVARASLPPEDGTVQLLNPRPTPWDREGQAAHRPK
jgi:hypothetical protein